jgi:TRAP-type transport system small permease protein
MSLDRVRHAYEIVLDTIVVVLMVAIAIEVAIGVIYRAIGQSLSRYDEVAVILLAWLTFYGSHGILVCAAI